MFRFHDSVFIAKYRQAGVVNPLIQRAFAFFLSLFAASLSAQDRILIQQSSGSRFPMPGYVEDYNGREILLKIKPNEPVRRYSRSDVIDVTTEYTPHHDKGRKLFAAGKVTEAKREFAASLDDEDRPWVRREILASLVKCALWTGDYHDAVVRFLPIVQSDPDTFHYGLIPLNWTDEPATTNVRFDAREWIGPQSIPILKLMGASWRLSEADTIEEAAQVLKRLAREPDVRIQRFAQMQLWRLKLSGKEQVTPAEIVRWEHFVEELPIELRGGSHFVIGRAWQKRQEFERAARAFLWLPFVYDSDHRLSARACFEAAESLNQVGDRIQACNLYSEVVFRYSDTPWGIKAEAAWNAIRPVKSP